MTKDERLRELNDRAARELVNAHKTRQDEPLILAVRFNIDDFDIHLLEVLRDFPGDDDDELLVTEFEPSAQLRIPGKLRLVLASPGQFRSNLKRGDKLFDEVRNGESLYDDGSKEAVELKKSLGL